MPNRVHALVSLSSQRTDFEPSQNTARRFPHSFKRLRKCTTYFIKRHRVMGISIGFQILTKSELTRTPLLFASLSHKCSVQKQKPKTCVFRGLWPTRPGCVAEPEQFCVPARNPLGHVVFYAPALACRLRLPPSPKGYGETRVLHHIG